MANNRNLAALGYLPSLNNGVTYGVVNGKWAAVSSGPTVTAWTNITLASGFTAGSPAPQYRKNGDVVEFRGYVAVTAAKAQNAVFSIFTMPAGFRPAYGGTSTNVGCCVPMTNSSAFYAAGLLFTDSSGIVQAVAPGGVVANGSIMLEGFSYTTLP